ncbi:hypothetical protein LSM04_001032 [Trypanosoma melophagium]|uniref:uncharacterized protein n=1 Tax=Trypanosoma melophagium TaxID=715481 RepID=UPI003519FC2C|nr:hypothetical protein LSM04_001032 [Trypanosoma melophagium]
MIGGNQILQVARSVANGDGDWGDVPRCVREAIVLALAGPDSYTAQQIDTAAAAAELLQQAQSQSQQNQQQEQQQRRYWSPWPTPREENRLVPSLTDEIIQRSVCTFEDAVWLRDQAVRSFAQFHNTVESLREGMRHHLRALWRTAIQLDPSLMYTVQREYNLQPSDAIPDSVAIGGEVQQQLLRLQSMIEELNSSVDTLRDTSVRFAANMLSDDEKRAMGLNPANLRPEDLRSRTASHLTSMMTTTTTSLHRNANAHDRARGRNSGSGGVPRMLFDQYRRNSEEERHQQQQEPYYYQQNQDHHHRHHLYHDYDQEEGDYRYRDESFTPQRGSAGGDKTVSEMRERYMQRIALLNEAALQKAADQITSRDQNTSRERPSSSWPSSLLSTKGSLL